MQTRNVDRPDALRLSLFVSLLLTVCVFLLLMAVTQPVLAAECNVPGQYATIQAAVNAATCDTINVSVGTFNEEISINRSLQIRGAGRTVSIINGSGAVRPITIAGTGTVVRLSGLRITNGRAIPAPNFGGGVLVKSGATLNGEDLQIDNNVASDLLQTGYGGGLAIQNGTAYLTDTLVLTNTAKSVNTGSGFGGGLYVAGDERAGRAILHLTDSEVRGNTAFASTVANVDRSLDGRGGGLYVGESDNTAIVLKGNTWARNVARGTNTFPGDGDGGAIAVDTGGKAATVTLTNDNFIDNIANASNGTIALDSARGGAIFLDTSAPGQIQATLEGVRASGNVAKLAQGGDAVGQGGALYARHSRLAVTGGTLDKNIAGRASVSGKRAQGGAIYLAATALTADSVRILDNIALQGNGSDTPGSDSQGGGIVVGDTATISLTNSLIADNAVSNAGGNGAGLYINGTATARIIHVTIANAARNPQEGIYAGPGGQAADIVITNTMVVSHATGIYNEGVNDRVAQNYMLYFRNNQNTVGTVSGNTGNVAGDPAFINPSERDYFILPESAAINAGTDAGVTTDINGTVRPQLGGFDIGAYERPSPISLTGGTIDGPLAGPPGEYVFGASPLPKYATEPISYLWDNGDTSAFSTRSLEQELNYTLTVTLTNNFGLGNAIISRTVTITPPESECAVPLIDLAITGPISGETGLEYTFNAVTFPGNATTPISFTWLPEPVSGQGTASASYTWATAGEKQVAVTAQNCGRSEASIQTITLMDPDPEPEQVYLPLVAR